VIGVERRPVHKGTHVERLNYRK